MKGIKKLLSERLKEKLEKDELEKLPSSYQQLGHVIILSLHKKLLPKKKIIAEEILKIVPKCKTVLLKKGPITGKFREPNLEFICGEKNFEVIHIENGCKFKFNVMKIMWSKGNLSERKRMTRIVKKDEVVIDMFAGIGYWCIPIAVHSNPSKIYAIELNPVAYNYLKENIKLNKVENKIIPIHGDSLIEVPKLGRIADRIIMGILPSPKKFLKAAFSAIKNGGIIHYEGISENPQKIFEEFLKEASSYNINAKLINWVKVKSYSPKKYHFVLDIQITF